MNILLIEDERPLALAIMRILSRNGWRAHWCNDGAEGFEEAKSAPYDLIILDILLPTRNGWSVCAELREAGINTPILVGSAMDETWDKVKGLNLGADDYLAKPFEASELVARATALLRRDEVHRGGVVRIADMEIDRRRRIVTRAGECVELEPVEYELLLKLAAHEGQVHSVESLTSLLESNNFIAEDVPSRIASLRRKVDRRGTGPLIHEFAGGYLVHTAAGVFA
jgi:two-component system copper resistance phosphate regulon response regulator CusR